jgi:hypothetical protein
MSSVAIADRVVVEEGRHSSRGASSASRWRNCAGSINLTEKLIADGKIKSFTSRPAAEGTAAHLVLATCLEDGDDAVSMKDVTIEVGDWVSVVDDEMVAGVQECLDWVRNRISQAKKDGFEVRLYIEKGMESVTSDDAYGTGDIILHIVGDRLIIVDFKYGRGVTVEPDSDQNYYYGYLSVENYLDSPDEVKQVECWIAQPRIPHPNGTIRRHMTSAKELTDWWFNNLLPDMQETYKQDAPLTIGEHCRFCPNKGHCPALKAEVFEFPVGIDPAHLADEELGEVLVKLDALVRAQPTFEAEALRRARGGAKIPGRKLVNQKGNRVWKDKQPIKASEDSDEMIEMTVMDAMLAAFGLEAYTDPAFKSPAQIEKLDKGNDFASQWAYSPNKGLTLAKMSDKRMEVRPNIERLYGVRKG